MNLSLNHENMNLVTSQVIDRSSANGILGGVDPSDQEVCVCHEPCQEPDMHETVNEKMPAQTPLQQKQVLLSS